MLRFLLERKTSLSRNISMKWLAQTVDQGRMMLQMHGLSKAPTESSICVERRDSAPR
ncbi:mCG147162 [Mus musculus]|nr:mCG147162 [Mus musculus]